MSEKMLHDAEIRRRYSRGHGTNVIAKALGLRLSHVIGRVRALRLSPPGNRPGVAAAEADMVSDRVSDPTASRPPDSRCLRPANSKAGIERPESPSGYDQDDDEPVRRKGCPRGWLVTEEQFVRSFHRSRGRFEDVTRRRRPTAARPESSTGNQDPIFP